MGIGLGFYGAVSAHGAVRLIPVKSDADEMLKKFLN
jgi:hypothetical protein